MNLARLHLLLTLLLTLVADLAVAQEGVTRGDALRRREFQSYGTTAQPYALATLYVDPTGSDTNACTSSGTGACRTIQGAWNKLPRFVRHSVTINVAATDDSGAPVTRLTEKIFTSPLGLVDGGVGTVTPTLTIAGASKVQWVPATGSATGTITATNLTDGVQTWTDSAQSWTAGNLDTQFIRFTSGTLSGRTFTIWGNTATTVNVIPTATPGIGDAYELVTNAVSYGPLVVGDLGLITVAISGIDFFSSSTTAACSSSGNTGTADSILRLSGTRCINSAVSGVAAVLNYLSVTGTTSSVPPVFWSYQSQALAISRGWSMTAQSGNFYARSDATGTSSNAFRATCIDGRTSTVMGCTWLGAVVKTTNAAATGPVAFLDGPGSWVSSGGTTAWLITECAPGATQVGVGLAASSNWALHNIHARNCSTGVSNQLNSTYWVPATTNLGANASNGTLACTSTATCLSLIRGGGFSFVTYTPSGVTTDFSLDGTSYTAAQLSSYSPARIETSYGTFLEDR